MNTMKTYKIELPDGENVKFRVAKRTSNWTLVEVVLKNEKILDYLKHFAEVSEQKEQEQKEKTQEKEENKSSGFSDKQIKEMQKLFKKFINKGINNLRKAKILHDKLEEIYIDAMNFKKVDKKKNSLIKEIFN